MIVRDGVVLHASPNQLAAFAARSGKLLWNQPKKYLQHLWYEWKDVFVIGGLVWTWSAELEQTTLDGAGAKGKQQRSTWPRSVNGYDLQTGELKKEVAVGPIFATHHHHRCYRNKATERYILASRRGTEFVDLEQGQHTVQNWVRGTCHVGMMPANGLQYAPPHPCQCYIEEKLNGFNALAPEAKSKSRKVEELESRKVERSKSQKVEERLEKGPAFGISGSSLSALRSSLSDDWPAFRHDSLRTGAVATRVADDATVLWRVPLGRRVAPPVAVGDQVFVSLVDEHHVACLSAQDGRRLWEFAAGARVDSPPTYHEGRVLFGSTDGCVYCLRAGDGQLAWRFRAHPVAADRRLRPAGIGLARLRKRAGPKRRRVLRRRPLVGIGRRHPAVRRRRSHGRIAVPDETRGPALHGREHPTELSSPARRAAGHPGRRRDESLHAFAGLRWGAETPARRTELQTKSGFLDDSYFKRTPWTLAGEYARLIVQDSNSACYVRMFDTLRALDPTVFFTPGGKGYLLFAKNLTGKSETWSQRVPLRIRAMVLTPQRLFVAGPPDVIDPQDPLGAFQGRKGGSLYVIDAATGQRLAEHTLTSPPVFNGAAAARGRLFLAAEDGSLTCLGKR